MLFGEFEHQLDQKNRLRLPSKLKPELGDKPIIICGNHNCLYVLPQSEMEIILSKLALIPEDDEEGQMAFTLFTQNAYQIDEDAQGRFILPSNLKKYANIDKNVLYIGKGNKVELWDRTEYDKYFGNGSVNMGNIYKSLSKYIK